MLLLSGVIRAEQDFIAVKPVPAPTSFIKVMEVNHGESLSTEKAKGMLKDLVAALTQDNDLSATIIFYERRKSSKEGLRTVNQVKNYLIKKVGINPDRIELLFGGYGDDLYSVKMQIYLVPPASRMPSTN